MKHTLQGEMYANSTGKDRFFEKIPDDVLEAAKLGLTDFFCLFSCRDQRTGQQKHP